MKQILAQFDLGYMIAAYITDGQATGLLPVPQGMLGEVDWAQEYAMDPLVQVKVVGDAFAGGISNGLSMRNSETVGKLRYTSQEATIAGDDVTTIATAFEAEDGQAATHRLIYHAGRHALISNVTYSKRVS